MMKKKCPISLILVCIIEIFLGILGSILFALSIDFATFRSVYFFRTYVDKVYTVGIDFEMLFLKGLYCTMTLPFVIILVCGIGTLLLKNWARKLNIIAVPIAAGFILSYAWAGLPLLSKVARWSSVWSISIPLWIFSVFKIWFFMRPPIKAQFD